MIQDSLIDWCAQVCTNTQNCTYKHRRKQSLILQIKLHTWKKLTKWTNTSYLVKPSRWQRLSAARRIACRFSEVSSNALTAKCAGKYTETGQQHFAELSERTYLERRTFGCRHEWCRCFPLLVAGGIVFMCLDCAQNYSVTCWQHFLFVFVFRLYIHQQTKQNSKNKSILLWQTKMVFPWCRAQRLTDKDSRERLIKDISTCGVCAIIDQIFFDHFHNFVVGLLFKVKEWGSGLGNKWSYKRHLHANTCTRSWAHTLEHKPAHEFAYITVGYTHIYVLSFSYSHACINACMHACICTGIQNTGMRRTWTP